MDTDGTEFMSNANGGKPYIDTTNFEANLEEAKQLLADAGYPDGRRLPVQSAIQQMMPVITR